MKLWPKYKHGRPSGLYLQAWIYAASTLVFAVLWAGIVYDEYQLGILTWRRLIMPAILVGSSLASTISAFIRSRRASWRCAQEGGYFPE
jgi:hypothetical protein